MSSFNELRRIFERRINEAVQEKTDAIASGSCPDFVAYKSKSAEIVALQGSVGIFIDCLHELNLKTNEEEDED